MKMIAGPLLCNIHLCDNFTFFKIFDFASCAYDTTISIVKEKNNLF